MAVVRGEKFELKMRTFKFLKDLTGVTVFQEVFDLLQRKTETIDDLHFIVQVLRACHRTANEKTKSDFVSEEDAYEWLEEWSPEEIESLFVELLKVFVEKKVSPSMRKASA